MAGPIKKLYSAKAVCEGCSVTQRMLDYWVSTGVIEPTKVFESKYKDRGDKKRRAYHLFDFTAIVQIKIVKDLRDGGVSLQQIRFAIGCLREERGEAWQRAWVVTDGSRLYEKTENPEKIVSLMKREKGQLVFSIIAVPTACDHVSRFLERWLPFPVDRLEHEHRGKLKDWHERTRSA